ncbi:unnamed protein product, partial [Urochloa humidicola]
MQKPASCRPGAPPMAAFVLSSCPCPSSSLKSLSSFNWHLAVVILDLLIVKELFTAGYASWVCIHLENLTYALHLSTKRVQHTDVLL